MPYRPKALITIFVLATLAAGCGGNPSASRNTTHHTQQGAGSGKNIKTSSKNKRSVQNAGSGPGPAHAAKPYSAPPATLPPGNIAAGSRVFTSTCASCHGSGATGTGKGPRLAHPSNVLSQFKTETALEVFIAHNMPSNNPGILSTKDAVNVASYVWHIAK